MASVIPNTIPTAAPSNVQLKDKSITQHIFHYLEECLEAFIAIWVYMALTNNAKLDVKRAIKIALMVGFLTFLLELYNPSFKSTLKAGMVSTVGSGLIQSYITV